MPGGPFSCFSKQGILLLLLSNFHYGVGVSSYLSFHKTVGDSVEIPAGLEGQNATIMQWKYRGKDIAEFNSEVVYSRGSQFDGRLELNVINFSLTIRKLTLQDSGEFLVTAETDKQIRTKAVTLQVHAGALILESPAYPITEGDSVTLRCANSYQETNPNPRVDFYKDGVLIRNETTGEMNIPAVSKSDEGFYKCKSNEGESPESWVTVRGSVVFISLLPRLLCGLLVVSPFLLVSIVLMIKCCRARGLCSTVKSPQDELPSDDVIKQTESSM